MCGGHKYMNLDKLGGRGLRYSGRRFGFGCQFCSLRIWRDIFSLHISRPSRVRIDSSSICSALHSNALEKSGPSISRSLVERVAPLMALIVDRFGNMALIMV